MAEYPEVQESSFEIESLKSVSNMLQSTEHSQMDYEDYLGVHLCVYLLMYVCEFVCVYLCTYKYICLYMYM
jgi:hypothetical protein